ncbi:hypothetical protein PUN28_014683 [Cardiocondyla obscurior]|uniref:Uncharacterized protein n=1 Tax=Cardiocondyla obscurior TaxID=286306 RepID=A0AAW2EY03_9HYME
MTRSLQVKIDLNINFLYKKERPPSPSPSEIYHSVSLPCTPRTIPTTRHLINTYVFFFFASTRRLLHHDAIIHFQNTYAHDASTWEEEERARVRSVRSRPTFCRFREQT